jgi:hypothetical protein
MGPTPKLRTAAAKNSAPRYARLIKPFGLVAVGGTTDKKKTAGIRIAAIRSSDPRESLPKGRKQCLVNMSKHDQR